MKTIISAWFYPAEAWISRRAPWKLRLKPDAPMLPGADLAGHQTGCFTTTVQDGSLADWHGGNVHCSATKIAAGAWLNGKSTILFGANDFDCIYAAV